MSSVKRKSPPAGLLQRRVRPRYEPEPDSDVEAEDMSDAPTEEGAGLNDDERFSEDDEMASGSEDEIDSQAGSDFEDGQDEEGQEQDEDNEDEDDEDKDEDDDASVHKIDAAQLSFGALAKAQASLGNLDSKRKRRRRESHGSHASSEASGTGAGGGGYVSARDREREELRAAQKRFEKPARTSKHAPTEMSSKRQVSRRRDFLSEGTLPKVQARDPRFLPLPSKSGSDPRIEEIKFRKAYAFLDDYREKEMNDLRAAVKKTKNADEKEKLQKALMAMENRKKAQERKEKERKVIEEHRKQEKELVKQGKTPYYLKKQEVKKKVLEDTFKGMKKKQVDKAIERRRKKMAGKEKKNLPFARRGASDR